MKHYTRKHSCYI